MIRRHLASCYFCVDLVALPPPLLTTIHIAHPHSHLPSLILHFSQPVRLCRSFLIPTDGPFLTDETEPNLQHPLRFFPPHHPSSHFFSNQWLTHLPLFPNSTRSSRVFTLNLPQNLFENRFNRTAVCESQISFDADVSIPSSWRCVGSFAPRTSIGTILPVELKTNATRSTPSPPSTSSPHYLDMSRRLEISFWQRQCDWLVDLCAMETECSSIFRWFLIYFISDALNALASLLSALHGIFHLNTDEFNSHISNPYIKDPDSNYSNINLSTLFSKKLTGSLALPYLLCQQQTVSSVCCELWEKCKSLDPLRFHFYACQQAKSRFTLSSAATIATASPPPPPSNPDTFSSPRLNAEIVGRRIEQFFSSTLTHLDLSHANISTMQPLASLLHLVHLNLDHNCIQRVSHCRLWHSLEHLSLRFNPISRLESLTEIAALGTSLIRLNIHGSPLSIQCCRPSSDTQQEISNTSHSASSLLLASLHRMIPSLQFVDSDAFTLDLEPELIQDFKMMRLAFELSMTSIPVGSAYCVGALLVSSTGKILSCGFSRELPGNTHAEECVLLKHDSQTTHETPSDNLINLTLYTTMEPCSTRLSGKKSCVERILDHPGVVRVVFGAKEPNHFVRNCKGVEMVEHSQRVVVNHSPIFDHELANAHLQSHLLWCLCNSLHFLFVT